MAPTDWQAHCVTRRVFRMFIVLPAFASLLAAAQPQQDPAAVLRRLLYQAQDLVKVGRTEDALETLTQAKQVATDLQSDYLSLQEELRWQRAETIFEYCDKMRDPDDRRNVATQAADAWKDYIDWYHSLSTDQHQTLKRTGRNRIYVVTKFLGDSRFRIPDPEGVLRDYTRVADITDLGFEAIDNWKAALYQCPRWAGEHGSRAVQQRKKICDDSCTDYWLTYASSLKDWAAEFNLRNEERKQYLAEAKRIETIATQCAQAAEQP
jgi:hypothetical protein